jgi:uncharacterized protein YyaL (SSP411 family)
MSEDDLFYSASDADSDAQEGTYFTYTYDEVYNTLIQNGYKNAAEMCVSLGVSHHGTFEGKSIIRLEGEHPHWFPEVKLLLQKLRTKRTYPFIDKKVQTSWSAMMIHSLFQLGAIDHTYKEKARKSLDALLETMVIDGTLYHTTLIHKTPKVQAFLEDYAFLSQALISAYKYTQDELYLIAAQRFVNKALEEFYDKGVWHFSKGEFTTKAETSDTTYTSSISIMVDLLLSLSTLLEDEKYKHFAFKTMEYNSYEMGRKPIYFRSMLTQVFRYLKGDRIIKSTQKNLETASIELAHILYPFIHLKMSEDDGFMICAQRSCFANTSDPKELNNLVSNSF